MEDLTGKTLSEIVKIADQRKVQILLVGDAGTGEVAIAHAKAVMEMKMKPEFLVVNIADLSKYDQDNLSEVKRKPSPFEREPIQIINLKAYEPEIFIDDKKPHFAGFKGKKLKGWKKRK